METTILILIVSLVICVSILNIVCFFLGAKVRQKVDRGETLKLPTINPFDLHREHQEKEKANKEIEKLEVILSNIEKYDGTSKGQKDVPN